MRATSEEGVEKRLAALEARATRKGAQMGSLEERLEKYGYDGDYLFVEANRRMLAEDTREWRERDLEIVEAW
jgi:hypothetical protein